MPTKEKLPELILDHCRKLSLPAKGLAYVREVVTSPPSRKVQSRRGNVTVRFASRKMRMTIQCESHTVELVFVIIQEHRQRTHWFYDQPLALKLKYTRPDGRAVTILHTPD